VTEASIEKRREDRIRGRLRRQGYALRKDRARTWSPNRQGAYRIVDADRNRIAAGERFDLDLDAVEAFAFDG
jgi:hypothetical protein